MKFDPDNRVMQLCAAGMQLEAKGDVAGARNSFEAAWNMAQDDFEQFTAAHYLARHQPDQQSALHWNLTALQHALLVPDDGMKAHYPSLHLNVGKSYEALGDRVQASAQYNIAAQYAGYLPQDGYGGLIRSGISEGLKRTVADRRNNEILDQLIEQWCSDRQLRALALILPVYVGSLGTAQDEQRLVSALSMLAAARFLTSDAQQQVEGLIATLAGSTGSIP